MRMRYVLLATSLAVAALFTACSEWFAPSVEPTSVKDAQDLADSLVFVKAKNGLCYGVTTTSRLATNFHAAEAVLMVNVPCDKVGQ